MPYGLLADIVVALHLAYVSFVILGQLAIFAGIIFKWNWIRNLWFRLAHLTMIVIVAGEAILSITCPLTRWEYDLRTLAGQRAQEGSFVGRLLHNLIFFDYVPKWVFTTGYTGFALLVLVTFLLAPPRRVRAYHLPEARG